MADSKVLEVVGPEIYDIFVEEITEIVQSLQTSIPAWQQARHDFKLLTEIRRNFHTLKGSGRMVSARALGDFAWAYESMLNQVLSGAIDTNDDLVGLMNYGVMQLDKRLPFFLETCESDQQVKVDVARVERFMAGEPVTWDTPVAEVAPEPVASPAPVLVEPAPTADSPSSKQNSSEQQADTAAHTDTELDGLVFIDFTQSANPKLPIPNQSRDAVATTLTNTIDFEGLTWLAPGDDGLISISEVLEKPATAKPLTVDAPRLVIDEETLLILKLFWEEVPDQLQELDNNLATLQYNPSDKDARLRLERVLHTLKGGARMAQINAIGDIAHDAESSLADTSGPVPEIILNELQTQIDQLNALVEHYEAETIKASEALEQGRNPNEPVEPAPAPVKHFEQLLQAPSIKLAPEVPKPANTPHVEYGSLLERVLEEQAPRLMHLTLDQTPILAHDDEAKPVEDDPLQSAAIQDQVRLPTIFLDRVIEQSSTMNVQQNRTYERIHSISTDVGELGRTVARLRHLLRSLELETEARVHAGHSEVVGQKRAGFDPLEMDQYSELQRLSRALAESMNDLINIEGDLTDQLRKSEQGLSESMQAGRKIYQDLLSTRLIALNVLVPRLKRVVRQTAQELNKQAELVIHGEDCELDRHLLQRLTAPLEHLLRNALAHGIETPSEREAAGKNASGQITLEVIQHDSELVIKVSDDGAGLNRAALRKRALEKGFIKDNEEITDAKLDRLILQPGFTTATAVNQIAGRGVGMDVVFSEIKSLGGSLHIESEQGQGATFFLRVPFTMASNPVLFVSVQGQVYGLGMGSIQGLIRLSGEQVKQKLNVPIEFLLFDGVQYPLRYLGQALKLRGLRDIQDDTMFPIIFTHINGQPKAWVVDLIVGRRDVVMQSLGVLFKNCPLYSAATITPDGQVVLLPDIHELVRAPLPESQRQVSSGIVMKRAKDQSRIMVVDDSITVRKVTEKFLVAESFAVETAKDGMEALEKLRDFTPDLMLLDIEMPRMDGFELLRHLRHTPEWKHLPVIMISSRTAEKHREHATTLGASDFLGKPYQNQSLLTKIREQLEGGALLRGIGA